MCVSVCLVVLGAVSVSPGLFPSVLLKRDLFVPLFLFYNALHIQRRQHVGICKRHAPPCCMNHPLRSDYLPLSLLWILLFVSCLNAEMKSFIQSFILLLVFVYQVYSWYYGNVSNTQ